jgi:WD40 repeat protein
MSAGLSKSRLRPGPIAAVLAFGAAALGTQPSFPQTRPPSADEVRARQAKFRQERKALVESGADRRFLPILSQKAEEFGKRADAALAAGRLGHAADLFRQARWQLPYQSSQVPPHVSRILGSLRLRHSQEINDLAFSPDGKRLATCGNDRIVKIWDMENGHEWLTYSGHSAKVYALAFSPDGKTIASAAGSPDIQLWDAATGKDIRTLKGKGESVKSLVFSRDGNFVVAAGDDKAVRFYEAATGIMKREITDFGMIVRKLAFSPDGSIMAAGVANGQIRLWEYPKVVASATQPEYWARQDFAGASYDIAFSPDGRTMARVGKDGVKLYNTPLPSSPVLVNAHRLLIQPPEPNNPFQCAVFSRDGKTLFTGGSDGVIRLWDPETGQSAGTFKGHSGEVRALMFNPAGTMLASASADYTARLWPFDMVLQCRDLKGHEGAVWNTSFSPDGQRVVSASSDKTVKIWDTASGTVLHSLRGHDAGSTVALFSPDGKTVLSGGGDKLLRLWDADTGKLLHVFKGHEGTVTAADFHPEGKQVASGGSDKQIRIWDIAGKELRLITTPSVVTAVAFSPDGKQLASGGVDQTIRLWDPHSGKETQSWTAHGVAVSALAYSPNGQWLASAGADHLVRVWPMSPKGTAGATSIVLSGHSGPLSSVAFRKDSLHLVSCGSDQLVKLWKLEGGTAKEMQTYRGHTDWVTSVAFSRDGYFVASASVDRTVKIWEITSRDIPLAPEHTGAVMAVAVSADGKLIASGATDRTIRLWDSETGLERATLTGHTDQVLSLSFMPDGKTLISSAADNTIRLWDVTSGKERPKKPNFIGLIQPVSYLMASPDGQKLLVWIPGTDRFTTITAFHPVTGNEVFTFNDNGRNVFVVAFTPAGDKVALGAKPDGSLRIYDLTKRGQPLPGGDWFIFKKGIELGDLAFTPDGKTIIVGNELGEISICDVATRKVLHSVKGHSRKIAVCMTSPDGKRFATAGYDNVVKLWEVDTGKELRSWDMHMPERDAFVINMTFTPDSRRLVTANANTTLYVLELP